MQDERVGLARQGDSEAFGSLIGGVADHLYAIAWRILRDGDRAQDALQQGLIAIWDQLPRLRDPEKFEAWAARVVVHASYREARRDRRWRSTIRAIEMAPAIGASIDPVLDRDQLERAFGRLSPEHRAVLVLHYFVGLSVAEVAETLGLPAGTVGSRLHYAIRSLRAATDADARLDTARVDTIGRSA